ncbi:MAG: class I SAM-dependent methyltransferase [candidate division Zixibacteria bacterium]|nr:class I SAM-dependent methyltransferase [candidate division Zixibacteria bacterium]
MVSPWYRTYFGGDYLRFDRHEDTTLEVEGLCRLLGAPENGPVLDVGCGYGRHALPLSERGYRVVGYDLSEAMMEKGRSQPSAVRWVRGDMRELPFSGVFDNVVSLFTSIGYFEDEADNFAVFREIAGALRPGGRFIAQMVNRDYLIRHFQREAILREDGLLILEERVFDPMGSRVHTETTVIDKRRTRRYTLSIRVYTITELDMLLAAAGLVVREIYGGLDFRTYDWDTNQLVVVAEKPTSVPENR